MANVKGFTTEDEHVETNKMYRREIAKLFNDYKQQVGEILSKHWNLIPNNIILERIKIITEDLANDSSPRLVRRAIYVCAQEMLDDDTLRTILPQLEDCMFDDSHDTVLAEFLNLVFKIKILDRFKHWDVLPIKLLITFLMNGSGDLQEVIVKLLYNFYLLEDKDPDHVFNRLMVLLALDYKCGKVFFEHPCQRLNAQDVPFIIDTIVANIDKNVIDNDSYDKRCANICTTATVNSDEPPTKCRRTDCSPVDDATMSDEDVSGDRRITNVNSSANLHNPHVMLGLIDILDILWEHNVDCSKLPDNIMNKLKIALITVLPKWFTYFQGSEVFIPLMKFMCRLSVVDYCLNPPVSMTTTWCDDDCSRYLETVCYAGCCDRILSLVDKMLKEVLTIPSWTDHSKLKLSFEDNVRLCDSLFARPMIAFKLIYHIFKNHSLSDSLKPSLSYIFTFWKKLGKIEQFISWRLALQDVSSYNVSSIDKFIKQCFLFYVQLIPLLEIIGKEIFSDDDCNSIKMFIQLLERTEQSLFPMIPKSLPLNRENKLNLCLLMDLLRYLLSVLINMANTGKSSTDLIIKICSYLSTICEQDTGLPLLMLAANYSWVATNFLYENYRNSTGTTIINENIIPLLSTIMKMVANTQDDKLILLWAKEEVSFWCYIRMMIRKIRFFDSEEIEASACFHNIVSVVINAAIIPLHNKIVNGIMIEYPLPQVTRKVISLLEDKAIVRKIYSKIFTENMNKHSPEDVDTLLAELNFLVLIICGIHNMDIEQKTTMFKLAKKSWKNMLSACSQNNSPISKIRITFADCFFRAIEKDIAEHLETTDFYLP